MSPGSGATGRGQGLPAPTAPALRYLHHAASQGRRQARSPESR